MHKSGYDRTPDGCVYATRAPSPPPARSRSRSRSRSPSPSPSPSPVTLTLRYVYGRSSSKKRDLDTQAAGRLRRIAHGVELSQRHKDFERKRNALSSLRYHVSLFTRSHLPSTPPSSEIIRPTGGLTDLLYSPIRPAGGGRGGENGRAQGVELGHVGVCVPACLQP